MTMVDIGTSFDAIRERILSIPVAWEFVDSGDWQQIHFLSVNLRDEFVQTAEEIKRTTLGRILELGEFIARHYQKTKKNLSVQEVVKIYQDEHRYKKVENVTYDFAEKAAMVRKRMLSPWLLYNAPY